MKGRSRRKKLHYFYVSYAIYFLFNLLISSFFCSLLPPSLIIILLNNQPQQTMSAEVYDEIEIEDLDFDAES